jgi:hypothetical protein
VRWLLVLAIACSDPPPKSELGAACEYDFQCDSNRCMARTCATEAAFQRSLLEQAGVVAPAEAPRIDSAGGQVRLRTAKGSTPLFAACAQDERLVGGSCTGGEACNGCRVRSYPSSPKPDDTIGGRWMCESGRGEAMAYALCQRVTAQ